MVAACVMTFEARDSAAKVVPARFKMSTAPAAVPSSSTLTPRHQGTHGGPCGLPVGTPLYSGHSTLRHSGSQTPGASGQCSADRRVLTQSFMQFSRGLALETGGQNRPSAPIKGVQVSLRWENRFLGLFIYFDGGW